jgi:hypothetical protein
MIYRVALASVDGYESTVFIGHETDFRKHDFISRTSLDENIFEIAQFSVPMKGIHISTTVLQVYFDLKYVLIRGQKT